MPGQAQRFFGALSGYLRQANSGILERDDGSGLAPDYCTWTRKITVPDAVEASEPVSVQTIAPAAPATGCVVTLQAVILAGKGTPQLADTKMKNKY